MKSEYLNEEKYQKTNKKLKTIGLIVLIFGICLVVGGIVLKIVPSEPARDSFNNVLDMGSTTEWFNSVRSDNKNSFASSALIMFGVFISFIGVVLRFLIGNRRQIAAYTIQEQVPIVEEGIEKMTPAVGKAVKNIAKNFKDGINEADQKK